MADKDVLKDLLDESGDYNPPDMNQLVSNINKQVAAKEAKEKKQQAPTETKTKVKPEEVAFETPIDHFRKLMLDMGYRIGVDTMGKVFFGGDTNNPGWLDEVLKLSNIPAKNRKLIITSYYGKTPEELGIKVEPTYGGAKTDKDREREKLIDELKKDEDKDDVAKFAEDEMKELLKREKTLTALANLRAMREEAEKKSASNNNQNQQQQVMNRKVTRPVIGADGKIVNDKAGGILYETVIEPVFQGSQQQSGGGDILSIVAAIKALTSDGDKKTPLADELKDYFNRMDQRINSMEKANELRMQEERMSRLEDEIKRKDEDYKRELQRKEDEYNRRISEQEKERVRDLESLEKRFTETINHRKELDDLIGAVSSNHKKEMDELKKRLEHAQTSIERTVVSKGTDTVDKLTTKMADVAESVVKPMASVLKDHYALAIDTQRQQLGLPTLDKSIPQVADDELSKFIQE